MFSGQFALRASRGNTALDASSVKSKPPSAFVWRGSVPNEKSYTSLTGAIPMPPIGSAPVFALRMLTSAGELWFNSHMLAPAVLVIGQRVDDAAVGHLPAATLSDHVLQLGSKPFQPPKLRLDRRQVHRRDLIDLAAIAVRLVGQIEQRANILKLKAEAPRMSDKRKPINVRRTVVAVVAARSRRLRQQADPFVVSDSLSIRAASAGKFTDLHEAIDPVVATGSI
jgi:hypothetical protein